MKKILSLLVLLVTTLSAFALDFTDYRKVTLGSYTPTESNDAKLSVTDNGDGTYNVTFNDIINKDGSYTDNYGTFTFSNVSGSKSGDVTTVTATDVTGTVSGGTYNITEFTKGNLSLKFKDGKAYATMTATCRVFYSNYTFDVVFGTDEGFGGGSTGGGETGGEDKPAIVDVVEADYAPNGASFGFPFTINWETQKLVAKLDLSTCSRYTHNEGIITVGTYNGNGDVSLWEPNTGEANCHLYYTHYYNGQDAKQLNLHYLEKPSDKVKRVDHSLQNLEPGLVVFTFDKDGLHVGDDLIASPGEMETLYNSTNLIFGSKEGSTRSNATYKYVKVVPLDWTEPTEPTKPEVKDTKTFNEALYMGGSKVADATVVVKEMSDETINMSLQFSGNEYTSTELTKGTDAKDRTTYTGKVSNGTQTYDVAGVVYEKDNVARLYMTMTTSVTTVVVGEDPDYVAPEPPAGESTIVENWQSTEGTSWSHDATIDWSTQKLVVSVNLANTSEDKSFLAVTKQGQTADWNDYGIIFYNNNASTVQGFAPGQDDNANTGKITKGEDPVRFEISKDGGVKCQGNVVMSADKIAHLTNQSNIVVGAADSKVGGAYYNYVKVVSLDWTEPTTPDTPEPVVYKNTLKVVRGTDTKTYENAEVSVLAKGENKYAVTIPSFTDMDQMEGTIGKLTFEATGVEDGGTLKLTATSAATTQEGGSGWDNAGFTASMDATVTGETLAGTFTVVYPGDATTYTYTLYYGVAAPDVITEVYNKTYTSNLRIFDGEETAVDEAEAKVNVTKYSDETYKITLKDVSLLNKTQDLVFEGTALVEETTAEATEPLTIIAKSDEATTAFFGEEMNGTFEITEVSAEEIKMGFVLNNTSLEYQGEFNYTEEETPEVYTSNLHIYDAAAPETDLFQADQAKVEFLATATGEFKLTLKDVTLNEKTQDLVFTGALPTPQPGGQDPLAEEGEGEVTPAEPAMVLNATADEATATFLGTTSATAVFNVIMNDEAETENDAFALTFTITAGEKTLGGEFNYKKQDTPDEKYPVNFDKTAKSTHNSRALNSFSLQQTGKDKQTESVYASKAAYEDHTSKVFTVEAGSELTASFDYTGEWMHSFVYIDFDNDGQFSYKEGQWDQTGTDLVAFSFYSLDSNPKNDASGYNSVGDELTGDARNTYVAPSFKAPAKAGEYRIRFKIDWNCILPGGSSSILSDGGGVWDATLKVVEPVVDGISSINAEVANGEAQLFTIDGVKLNKLQKGLNIVRTADGKVKKVLVK